MNNSSIGRPPIFWERAEIHAKLHNREQIKRFLRGHRMGISQNAIGAADLVAERLGFFLEQNLARVVFLINNRFDDLASDDR